MVIVITIIEVAAIDVRDLLEAAEPAWRVSATITIRIRADKLASRIMMMMLDVGP